MHNWANFCDIIKFNAKNENLVTIIAARFFLCEKSCAKLEGKTVYLAPPALDIKRKFVVKHAKFKQPNKLELNLDGIGVCGPNLVGRSLLLSNKDAIDVFGDFSTSQNEEHIGKTIVDINLGNIGIVKDLAGTSAQKHFIVKYQNSEVLVPLAADLIVSVNEDSIVMDLPKGILEVNEA